MIRRVHFTGGDKVGWAIDEDLRLVREALAGECESTSLAQAEAVHVPWWVNVLPFSRDELRGKHVVCTAENSPFYYITEPEFLKARERVTQWIVRSHEGAAQFAALGIASRYAPYTFDPAIFHPLAPDSAPVLDLVRRWKIPADRYLVANFHRDTEGADLQSPKLQKGPDLFLEIVALLHARGAPIHVLLAGPRRFFLRRSLAARGVPFTFVGEDTGDRDDLAENTLPRTALNVLYSVADLHLVSSRWEGGPQSVLESAATRCKILSTRVGLAPDVLEAECLFGDAIEACEAIERDIAAGALDRTIEPQHARVHASHTEPELRRHMREIYRSLEPLPPVRTSPLAGLGRSLRRAAGRFQTKESAPSFAVLHRGKQDAFLTALCTELTARGCTVRRNALDPAPDAILLGSLPADDSLRDCAAPVIAFVDGDAEVQRMDCAIVPSLDAYVEWRAKRALPARVLVFALPGEDGATPAEDVCIVSRGMSAACIQQALAHGIPVVYPADSHAGQLVWFGGLAYRGEADLAAKLDTVRRHYAMFQRLAMPPAIGPVADRLIRLVGVLRESMNDEHRN